MGWHKRLVLPLLAQYGSWKTMQANKRNGSDPGFIYNFSAVSKNIDFPLLAGEWPEKSNFKILIFKLRLHTAITIAKSLII